MAFRRSRVRSPSAPRKTRESVPSDGVRREGRGSDAFEAKFQGAMPYFVYILYSPSMNKYYVGSSKDVAERVRRHNIGARAYTNPGRPWELVHMETFESLGKARKREYEIKGRKSRKYIQQLILQK